MTTLATELLALALEPKPAPTTSLFLNLEGIASTARTVFGIILLIVAVGMVWRSKKAKIKENGTILGNVGMAAFVMVLASGAMLWPAIKSFIATFTTLPV